MLMTSATTVTPPGLLLAHWALVDVRRIAPVLSRATTTTGDLDCVNRDSTSADPVRIVSQFTAEQPSPGSGELVLELRRLSGLTWEQLAQVLNVTRRSLHLWTNGRPVNGVNEERLQRTLAALRYVDRGSAEENRALLLSIRPNGTRLGDMLRDLAYDAFKSAAGPGKGRTVRPKTSLSIEEEQGRRPTDPAILLDALQDPIPGTGHAPPSTSRRFAIGRPNRL